jgi:hypothetical protein
VLALLRGEEVLNSDYVMEKAQEASAEEMVGGLATLLMFIWALPIQTLRNGMITMPETEHRPKLTCSIADILVPRILADGIGSREAAIVAGALWALQLGEDPAIWRAMIPVELTPDETAAWLSATRFSAMVMDDRHGNGTGETLIYFAIEKTSAS